jgi:hypothetical protein
VQPILRGLIRAWPWSSSAKQVRGGGCGQVRMCGGPTGLLALPPPLPLSQIVFLNEVEELLEMAGPDWGWRWSERCDAAFSSPPHHPSAPCPALPAGPAHVKPVLPLLVQTLAKCVGSTHFQVSPWERGGGGGGRASSCSGGYSPAPSAFPLPLSPAVRRLLSAPSSSGTQVCARRRGRWGQVRNMELPRCYRWCAPPLVPCPLLGTQPRLPALTTPPPESLINGGVLSKDCAAAVLPAVYAPLVVRVEGSSPAWSQEACL